MGVPNALSKGISYRGPKGEDPILFRSTERIRVLHMVRGIQKKL